jgi:membrane protein implicated in regulation of membrane protease activity
VDDPESWRWFWLIATLVFAVSELAAPGTFFMLSFAAGAFVASVLAFAGVGVGWEWAAFVVVSAIALAALVPIGRRINAKPSADRVGATRLNGRRAVVLQAIPSGPHATGRVRVEREEWRAESADGGSIEPGQTVVVLRVDGTRLIVRALETFEEHL